MLKTTWQAGGRTETRAWKCLLLFCLLKSQTTLTRMNVMRKGARERVHKNFSPFITPLHAHEGPDPSYAEPSARGRFRKDQGEM